MGLGDLFGDSGDFWSSFGDGGVLDSGGGGSWTDYLGGDWGDGSGSFLDFGGDSGGSSGGGILKTIEGLFGGGQGGSSGSSIFGGLLSGLGAGASAALSGKDLKDSIKLKGEQDRLTLAQAGLQDRQAVDFEASLKDYYTQQDKRRKRIALDTYGQFSTIDKIKPGYTDTAMPTVPSKPSPSGY